MGNPDFNSSAWADFSELVHRLEVQQETRLKSTHGRFNIFTTLLSASDEVRLHTRFLVQLLNPHGTHDCRDLFLRLFFQMLDMHPPLTHEGAEKDESNFSTLQEHRWTVEKEIRKKQGQLDILLRAK